MQLEKMGKALCYWSSQRESSRNENLRPGVTHLSYLLREHLSSQTKNQNKILRRTRTFVTS